MDELHILYQVIIRILGYFYSKVEIKQRLNLCLAEVVHFHAVAISYKR
jgi:hypothetical protein